MLPHLTFSLQAKYYQKLAEDREKILPYIQSDSDLQALVSKPEPLTHSKTEVNLNKNGFNHNNFLLQNMGNFEQVSLIPVPVNERAQPDTEGELHSRGSNHVFNV